MAVAAYTTDLSAAGNLVDDAEGTDANWTETTTWAQGGGPGAEPDYYIQGTGSQSQTVTKSGLASAVYNKGSGITIPSDGAMLVWMNAVVTGLLATDANGGLRLIMGSGLAAFNAWNLGGKDSYTYGGWVNLAVNPTINGGTADYTVGAPSGTLQYLGAGINLTAGASRGNLFSVDVIRYGRCESRFAGGTSPDAACTFAGFAAVNDNASNRYGLLQAVSGGYLYKGLMVLGYGAACRFTDSNTMVMVDNTKKVTTAFNRIEIRNASSEVNWTGIAFLALGTVSRGQLEVVDDCDVNIAGCSFTGMDTFIFKSATDVLTSVFRGCRVITANGANFAGTQFIGYEGSANSSYLSWNTNVDPQSKLANCAFTKGTAATHAIEIGTSGPTTIHIPTSCTFSGYNASDEQNDSTLYIANTTDTINIYYDGEISYKRAGSNTVNILASQPTLTIEANVDLTGAEIRIYDLDGTLPYLGTELAGTESCPTETYDYTGSASNVIWVQIMKDGYIEYGQSVTMPTADQTINVLLTYDVAAEVTVEEGDFPTIVDVDPNPSYAGQQATIIGTNFDIAPVSVDFGGVPATDVSVTNSTTLTCTIPAHADGYVGVTVINGDGSSDPYSFLYQAPSGGGSLAPVRRPRYGALLQT